jgi:hypothetical protein
VRVGAPSGGVARADAKNLMVTRWLKHGSSRSVLTVTAEADSVERRDT